MNIIVFGPVNWLSNTHSLFPSTPRSTWLSSIVYHSRTFIGTSDGDYQVFLMTLITQSIWNWVPSYCLGLWSLCLQERWVVILLSFSDSTEVNLIPFILLSHSFTSQASKKIWKRLRPSESLGKITLQPAEPPAGYSLCCRYPSFVTCPHASMGFGFAAAFYSFLLLQLNHRPHFC